MQCPLGCKPAQIWAASYLPLWQGHRKQLDNAENSSSSGDDLLQEIQLLGEDQFQMVEAVRTLMKKTGSPLSEEVKYGGILFSEATPFAGVFAYREHVSVEFGHGAKIKDVDGFLEGSGKGRRHIKLKSLQDVSTKKLASYIPLAWAAARSGA
jgi:hypothetical protein